MRKQMSVLGGCCAMAAMLWAAAPSAPANEKELRALMPWDLGPATIDVSSYPQDKQAEYGLFLKKCSVCHTPARAINSTLTSEEDWERFVNLMHARFQSRMQGRLWTKAEGRKIVDFLSYDSQVRKVEHRTDFMRQQKELSARWDEVQKEKQHRQQHQTTQPSAPYTGANP